MKALVPTNNLTAMVRLADVAEPGRLHAEIGSVSPWEETAARITDLRERLIRGKAILRLDHNRDN